MFVTPEARYGCFLAKMLRPRGCWFRLGTNFLFADDCLGQHSHDPRFLRRMETLAASRLRPSGIGTSLTSRWVEDREWPAVAPRKRPINLRAGGQFTRKGTLRLEVSPLTVTAVTVTA